MKKITLKLLSGLLFLGLAGCQTISEPSQLMELNRQGEWKKVRDSGLVHLRELEELEEVQVCDSYYNLIYAEIRLGMKKDAKVHLEEFKQLLRDLKLPATHLWIEAELEKLEKELDA